MIKRINIKNNKSTLMVDVLSNKFRFYANGEQYEFNRDEFLNLIGAKECVETTQ